MDKKMIPNAKTHLQGFVDLLKLQIPFSFVRFSDGEIEVLRNRYLEIDNGKTVFRGRSFKNSFPQFDSKRFDPRIHQNIRKDLLASAMFRKDNFFKGIPTSHNNAIIDREFMLRLNGGYTSEVTFADLLLNSNYQSYRNHVIPLLGEYENIYVIANYRSKLMGVLASATHISIPDNFFEKYDEVLEDVMLQLTSIEPRAIVISSASSLSNVVAFRIAQQRADITFLDVGTSLNDLLSLDSGTRAYHATTKGWVKRFFYQSTKGYEIKW
jgi:hypothetical protein